MSEVNVLHAFVVLNVSHASLRQDLAEMKDGAPLVVVPRLLQIAGDGRYALSARRHAVAAIGALGGRA